MTAEIEKIYLEILKDELVPAMGCTEPISVAYASALARKVLGALPTRVTLTVSANIIKNVKHGREWTQCFHSQRLTQCLHIVGLK